MTIANVIQGIVNALYTKFGSAKKFYTESVNQSLTEPCFLIKCLDPAQNVDLGKRYKKTHQFSVQYFPSVQGSISECMTTLEDMFECLQNISVSITEGQTTKNYVIHGADLQGQVTDGVLTFTVNYDLFLLKQEQAETGMGTLDVSVGSN